MKPIRTTLAALATALLLATGLTATPAAAQTVDVWDSGIIHDVAVSVDQNDFDAMVQEYLDSGDKTWISADVTIDGTTLLGAGIKLKGQSSLFGLTPDSSPSSLPWLIRLDKYTEQDYQGYKRFVVRSNYTETSLNEAVALRVLEQTGLATTKSFPTAFSVNGEQPVLRLIVQELDKTFDKEHFPAPDGSKDGGTLYKKKWDEGFEYLGDDPDAYDGAWEPKGGDEDNWQPLFEFVDWMNNASDAQYAAELESRLETEKFARYLAVQDLILNWDDIDGPGQNGFLRHTPSTGKMTVVAWDHNLSYGIFPAPPRPPGPEDPNDGRRTTWGCPCVERSLEVPEFRELYERTFFELKSELYDSGFAQSALDELAATLYQSNLVSDSSVDQDVAQIQAVFTQDITPRTGATAPPDGPNPPDPTDPPPTDTGCTAEINVVNDWGSGWQGNVQITAGGSDVDGWTLTWTWPGSQSLSSHWNADVTASGATVMARDVGWNAGISAGQTVEAWGFVGSGAAATPEVSCEAG
ncbi:hypothetical protein GCM10027447_30450 [Glycomyces halotolerans]